HDRAQPTGTGLAVDGLAGNGADRLLRQREIDRLHLEQALILLHQRIFGLGENELERGLIEILERGHDGQTADEFGDQAIFQQVFRLDLTENFAGLAVLRRNYLGAEANRGCPPARRDDLLEPIEGAAAHEQDVSRVDLQEFLLRMLASALRRCMSSEHFGQLAWQFKRMSGSSGLKVQAAIACGCRRRFWSLVFRLIFSLRSRMAWPRPK